MYPVAKSIPAGRGMVIIPDLKVEYFGIGGSFCQSQKSATRSGLIGHGRAGIDQESFCQMHYDRHMKVTENDDAAIRKFLIEIPVERLHVGRGITLGPGNVEIADLLGLVAVQDSDAMIHERDYFRPGKSGREIGIIHVPRNGNDVVESMEIEQGFHADKVAGVNDHVAGPQEVGYFASQTGLPVPHMCVRNNTYTHLVPNARKSMIQR